eukprot:Em0015g621a
MYLYLKDSAYPNQCSASLKQQIRLRSKKFELRNGELYYRLGERDVVKYIQNPKEWHKNALACHVHPTSGHLDVKKTIARVKERFTWKGVVEDVKNIVYTCDLCQRMNSKLTTATPELHPVPVQSPWFHLGVNFIGPISPVSSKGNCFILTLSDYFIKWVEAVPLPTKESNGIAEALIRIFLRMGFPTLVTTDQGGEFRSGLDAEMMKELEIQHYFTTPYHTAQGKQQQTYDRRHARPCGFQVGTLVVRKDFKRKKRKGEKMDAKWLGPFLLSSELGKLSESILPQPSSLKQLTSSASHKQPIAADAVT